MEELVRKMIRELRVKAETEVPERGEFGIVWVRVPNPNKKLDATDFMLKVTKPPRSIENHEVKRYLEFVVYQLPSPYIAERVVGHGTKQDILACLDDEEPLVKKIVEIIPRMVDDLSDI